jgi:hypothetical protein
VYSTNGTAWIPVNSTNTSYVPPNFLYASTPPTPVSITLQTSPAGLQYAVDGTTYTSTLTFTWVAGSAHTIAAASQDAGTGQRYQWSNWSDSGGASHSVSPSAATTYTANFNLQYLLTSTASPAGSGSITASPASQSGYYDAGTSVQLTAVTGGGSTFLNWGGDLSGSTSPANLVMSSPRSVSANFEASSSGSQLADFLTSFAPGSRAIRNDFGGWVGMRLTIGTSPLSVPKLGRICLSGNSGTHPVKFVNAATGSDVPGASVALNMAGCSPGQFQYAPLSAPVTLPAGGTYYLVSQEFQGGDRWYNAGPVAPSPGATVNGTVYSSRANWIGGGSANTSYVPPSFQYTALPPDPNSPFVTGFSSNSLRNNFTGWVGMKVIVGSTPVTVSSLGRICVAGNTGSHSVKLVDALTGLDLSGGSANISMPGCVAGQFAYAPLAAPMTLLPGKTYYLVSQELTGGDRWYDLGPVSASTLATILSGVYSSGSAWMSIGGASNSYGPLNFK